MNAAAQLRVVRAILVIGVLLRALAWGIAASLTLLVGVTLVDLATPLSFAVRAPLLIVALLAGAAVACTLAWRDRTVISLERVALWVEERFPSLDYRLVTMLETGRAAALPIPPREWIALARRRTARAAGGPIAIVVAIAFVIVLLPEGAVAHVRSPRPEDALEWPGSPSAAASRLQPLVASIMPPAYSGEHESTVNEPRDVHALEGSMFTLRGRGDGSTVVARIAGDSDITGQLHVTTTNGAWTLTLRVPARPVVVELRDRTFTRMVAIEPVADTPPVVTLLAPAHDSVLRTPNGSIPLLARASDDFGVDSAVFEYIISSGEGETFTFRSGVLGVAKPHATAASLSATLSLDALALQPGDIVHIRAVARDGNTVTGPGIGVSETRSIRIARADEYDSVAVDAAAPTEADKSLVSERMLIMLTEALEAKRRVLPRDTMLAESHTIARDQQTLRRTVGDLVFTRLGGNPSIEEHSDSDETGQAKSMQDLLTRAEAATNRTDDPIDFEGGESPVVAVNKPLLEAYNAMWDASTSLEQGELNDALPHMRRALAAIQRARQADRVYLRGAPPPVIVDVDKVRLIGKDKGTSSVLPGAPPLDSASAASADRFARIVELSRKHPRAAADSMLLFRIEMLDENPAFAAALGDAAAAIRSGRGSDATSALARARRSLDGPAVGRDSLSRWGGGGRVR